MANGRQGKRLNSVGVSIVLFVSAILLGACENPPSKENPPPQESSFLPTPEESAALDRHMAQLDLAQGRWYLVKRGNYHVPAQMASDTVLESYPPQVSLQIPACDCREVYSVVDVMPLQVIFSGGGHFEQRVDEAWVVVPIAVSVDLWLIQEKEDWRKADPARLHWVSAASGEAP